MIRFDSIRFILRRNVGTLPLSRLLTFAGQPESISRRCSDLTYIARLPLVYILDWPPFIRRHHYRLIFFCPAINQVDSEKMSSDNNNNEPDQPNLPQEEEVTIGVLALQGAFEEHQERLERIGGVKTVQVRTPAELTTIDGIVLPGGESTAMGLIGSHDGTWDALKEFINGSADNNTGGKPSWGTCAGMVLLSDRCVGTSAVITNGQSLIGGLDVLVCRNYFGSQVSSFELSTPCPPKEGRVIATNNDEAQEEEPDYPGVFIRAPAILNAGSDVTVLGKVLATPCRQAAVVLRELERKIEAGEDVVNMGVVDALVRDSDKEGEGKKAYVDVQEEEEEEKKETTLSDNSLHLPGAASCGSREVICAVRKNNILCTAFHPELTQDLRWHKYFVGIVRECKRKS